MKNGWKTIIACGLVFALVLMIPVQAQETGDEVEVTGTEIDVRIHNSYAITEVKRHMVNNANIAQEHMFTFSVPETAFVSNLTVETESGVMFSVAIPADLAEAVYEYQVETGATASMLSSQGSSIFTHNLNLEAGEQATLIFRYEQMIPKQLGFYNYEIFVDPDAKNTSFDFNAEIQYEEAIDNIDIQGLANPDIEFINPNKARISRTGGVDEVPDMITLNYTVALPPSEGRMIFYDDGETGYFMHIFSPTVEAVGGQTMPKQIEFVLDKSGSMSGDKMTQMKEAFNAILPALDSRDMFGVVTFSDVIDEPVSDHIIPANSGNIADAVDAVEDIQAGGSTNIGLAMETGLDQQKSDECANPILVLLTDGLPSSGIVESEPLREHIRNCNDIEAKIYCLGFGSNVDFQLLSAIALENGGEAIRIDTGLNAADQITDFYGMISVTMMSDIIFEYSPGAEMWYPETANNLFNGSEIIISGQYEKDQNELHANVNGTTEQGAISYSKTFSIGSDPNDEYVSRFWGYSRINHLLDEITVQGEQSELLNETIELAMQFNFVTEYTSYIAGDAVDEALDNIDHSSLVTYGNSYPDSSGSVQGASPDDSNSTPGPGFSLILVLMVAVAMLTGIRRKRRN